MLGFRTTSAELHLTHKYHILLKSPFSHEKSLGLIVKDKGERFDPTLVDEFVKISDRIYECLRAKEQILIKEQYFNFYNNNK